MNPIQPFVYEPKPQSPRGHRLCYTFFLLAIGAVLIAPFLPSYRGVASLAAMAFIIVGLSLYGKYVAVQYIYSMETDASDRPRFTVSARIGKRLTTYFSAYVSDLVEITRVEASQEKRRETAQRFYYYPTMSPTVSYRLLFRADGTDRAVYIEIPDDLAVTLSDAARALRGE